MGEIPHKHDEYRIPVEEELQTRIDDTLNNTQALVMRSGVLPTTLPAEMLGWSGLCRYEFPKENICDFIFSRTDEAQTKASTDTLIRYDAVRKQINLWIDPAADEPRSDHVFLSGSLSFDVYEALETLHGWLVRENWKRLLTERSQEDRLAALNYLKKAEKICLELLGTEGYSFTSVPEGDLDSEAGRLIRERQFISTDLMIKERQRGKIIRMRPGLMQKVIGSSQEQTEIEFEPTSEITVLSGDISYRFNPGDSRRMIPESESHLAESELYSSPEEIHIEADLLDKLKSARSIAARKH